MTRPVIHRVTQLDLSVQPWSWPFANERRAEIEAHFALKCREKPQLWNGRVLLGRHPVFAEDCLSAGYFETVRTPLLSGRTIEEKDIAGGSPVVVINATAAKHFFAGQNPIGKHLAISRDMLQREIVGVVADVKFNALNAANVEEMYLPMAQVPWPNTSG